MNFTGKKIGIWGFGIVGQSAARFFYKKEASLTIVDKKELNPYEQKLVHTFNAQYKVQTAESLSALAQESDYILISPGIDLRSYSEIRKKLITELDIFTHFFHKPVVAITGTIGKTSVTHLLTTVLQTGKKWINGGNIGVGMLDLIEQQDSCDGIVLELSSFQLEYCRTFAPNLAIWTNLFPNHLDRHGTFADYATAKLNILAHQKSHQQALLPLSLLQNAEIAKTLMSLPSKLSFFSAQKPASIHARADAVFWIENNSIVCYRNGTFSTVIELHRLPALSFKENWLIICAAVSLLNFPIASCEQLAMNEQPLEHRLEKVTTIRGITFYNDSKSTVPEATIAALQSFTTPIILLLGGVSKGVDRSSFIASLNQFALRTVIAFGKEAEFIKEIAVQNNVPCCAVATVEEAVAESVRCAQTNDIILFSPAGASFDLFANYQERGKRFKELVHLYGITSTKELT